MKKAYFFSLDMLIAIVVLISATSVLHIYSTSKQYTEQETYYASDLLDILSSVKISELTDSNLVAIINQTNKSNMNITILEYVGRLYFTGQENAAKGLLANLSQGLFSEELGFGVWIAGENESKDIYENEFMQGKTLIASKQMVTGIEETKPITGFNSRIFLTGINKQFSSYYAYFGGYVGDGKISKRVILPSNYDSVTLAYIELNAGSDFNLYINGQLSGRYNATPGNLIADNWTIDTTYLDNFQTGDNTLIFDFLDINSSFIGGGYVVVHYTTTISETYDFNQKTDYLPGIEGIVNIYDSFYVPGNLSSMTVYLNYNSNYSLFLTIGNTTVLSSTEPGVHDITLDDSNLSGLLDYDSLNKKTTPFRLGTLSTPDTPGGTSGADIVLVTDLSNSMYLEIGSENNGIERNCTDPLIYDSTTSRISVVKCLDKQFIDAVLSNPANQVALSGFYGDPLEPYHGNVIPEDLTNDAEYLKQRIDDYTPQGGTPICASLNHAYKVFDEQSSELRQKYVIIMSDGIPTHQCGAMGVDKCKGEKTGLPGELDVLWLGQASCHYMGIGVCDGTENDCDCGIANANWSSCEVHEDFNATVHSIGFGPVAECLMADKTLRDVAECGGGDYYASDNATVLQQLYQNLSELILTLGYNAQTAYSLTSISTAVLYPDSYFKFEYTPELPVEEYGKIPVTIESKRFNNNITEGNFTIPTELTVYEAKVTSYSGERWTDNTFIDNSAYNWLNFYNLSTIGDYYYILGDPYVVNIPIEYIRTGLNSIRIKTGTDSLNSSGGSPQDKVIYTAGVDVTINTTGIYGKAEGCIWYIEFEDGTAGTLTVPPTYIGTEICYFNQTTDCAADYSGDAVNNAMCNLFKQLDFDDDGLLFVKLGPTDLSIETSLITDIPYMWGPTLMEVRIWR